MKVVQAVAMFALTLSLLWGYAFLGVSLLTDFQIDQSDISLLAVSAMVIAQTVWAVVAGIMVKSRGWRMVETGFKPVDIISNITLSGTAFLFPTIIMSWHSFFVRGKWFPTPLEC